MIKVFWDVFFAVTSTACSVVCDFFGVREQAFRFCCPLSEGLRFETHKNEDERKEHRASPFGPLGQNSVSDGLWWSTAKMMNLCRSCWSSRAHKVPRSSPTKKMSLLA